MKSLSFSEKVKTVFCFLFTILFVMKIGSPQLVPWVSWKVVLLPFIVALAGIYLIAALLLVEFGAMLIKEYVQSHFKNDGRTVWQKFFNTKK